MNAGQDLDAGQMVGYDVPAQVDAGQAGHDVPDRAQVSAVGSPNGHATVLEDATC